MSATPRRPLTYSLRTMFILVAFVAVWLSSSLSWIKQRRDFMQCDGARLRTLCKLSTARAPGLLWLFGEKGVPGVTVLRDDPALLETARELFPEAVVEFGGAE